MSLENLRPREPFWGEAKKKRHPFMTDVAWHGWQEIASLLGYSVSETMERIARKELSLEEFGKLSKWLLTKSN
ncbi:hypothetical protein G7B40_012760 [Aetokthonos hydrillicola Thurmond2011]|jgi:hypothetical protein|uniref:Uncharacterized protein n=1 Tax=Aetokthonos hydrillicola Thurmond2011 TaxID=2712845 RepID=A0AAP5I5J6_9CYAN|nr:hypothetical protein [Aetokthonos hydrillicola]MBO3461748.1 hypothetical protein [Aetokthonos hydrillicola CCALA 1050]MBW4583871.1 hypothetical protein [Aetokthonos hydrillicola CCALA 1050]MDR9895432.1 hypothetical protein [Aetokthonos hydrillicola Thurmond2011]